MRRLVESVSQAAPSRYDCGSRRYLRNERTNVTTVMTRKIVPETSGTGIPPLKSGWAIQNSG
jgi:hypothetical protein